MIMDHLDHKELKSAKQHGKNAIKEPGDAMMIGLIATKHIIWKRKIDAITDMNNVVK